MGARDIPPDNGQRPPFAQPIDQGLGDIGTKGGYSGQEYDAAGQDAWRAAEERKTVDPGGAVHGSGAGAGGGPGEDYDSDTANGTKPPPSGAGG